MKRLNPADYEERQLEDFSKYMFGMSYQTLKKTPAGKRDGISLREKEVQIKKRNDGIDTVGGKMTVCQLYDKKNSQGKNIKRTRKMTRWI